MLNRPMPSQVFAKNHARSALEYAALDDVAVDDLSLLFDAALARLTRSVSDVPTVRGEVSECVEALKQLHGMLLNELARRSVQRTDPGDTLSQTVGG